MFDRLRRRRRANANTQNTEEVPWDSHLERPQHPKEVHDADDRQDAQVDEALLSPSINSLSPPATPRTPDPLPSTESDEKTFRTNGEYYDQFLIRNNPYLQGTCAPAPNLYDMSVSRATSRPRHPPTLRNTGTLRGMPLPLPRRTPIEPTARGIDPTSPIPSDSCQSLSQPSQVVGMMAPRPTASKKRVEKPKSLNLKSFAFHTKAKSIYNREPTSASITQRPKPSPAMSVASQASVADEGASSLISAASAPAFSSKWRGEFKDLIPQFAIPQTAVPWRKKRQTNIFKDRKKITSKLESTPDDLLGAKHISPPMMSNWLSDDPIPPAFFPSGTARRSYGISPGSSGSNGSAVSPAQMSHVRSTELVVRKNARFELPVSSGKSLLFS